MCNSLYAHTNAQAEDKQISLSGNLPDNQTRSIIGFQKIIAIQTEMDIQIWFAVNISVINIQIIDEYGNRVYYNEVNSNAITNLSINTLGLGSGTYKIRFTNSLNQYLEGNFVIQ